MMRATGSRILADCRVKAKALRPVSGARGVVLGEPDRRKRGRRR
jgi:hypothetical protein